ncbi:MAG: hypothetical protein JST54_05955 [Deltaproteobacteria bacterium]|nr:hypothetical protein [Deltaproteobacteria bacterium]
MHHELMLYGITSAIGTLIRAGVDVGFLVVAFAVVRPRGLDGAGLLAGGGAVRIASSLFMFIQWPVLNYLVAGQLEPESFRNLTMLGTTFVGLVSDVGTAMLVAGVVSLARSAAPRVLSAAPGTTPGS